MHWRYAALFVRQRSWPWPRFVASSPYDRGYADPQSLGAHPESPRRACFPGRPPFRPTAGAIASRKYPTPLVCGQKARSMLATRSSIVHSPEPRLAAVQKIGVVREPLVAWIGFKCLRASTAWAQMKRRVDNWLRSRVSFMLGNALGLPSNANGGSRARIGRTRTRGGGAQQSASLPRSMASGASFFPMALVNASARTLF